MIAPLANGIDTRPVQTKVTFIPNTNTIVVSNQHFTRSLTFELLLELLDLPGQVRLNHILCRGSAWPLSQN